MLEIIFDLLANNAVPLAENVSTETAAFPPKAAAALGVGPVSYTHLTLPTKRIV